MRINDLIETVADGHSIDLDHAYELFHHSYQQETGTAWSKEKFLSRVRGWGVLR